MRIINTTSWPDHFIRRCVSWCCRELEVPVRHIAAVKVRNGGGNTGHVRANWDGTASIICITVGKSDDQMARLIQLVSTAAHEVSHVSSTIWQARARRRGTRFRQPHGGRERLTRKNEEAIARKFTENHAAILVDWLRPVKLPAQEIRQARRLHDKWVRKREAAQRKVLTYRKRIRALTGSRYLLDKPL